MKNTRIVLLALTLTASALHAAPAPAPQTSANAPAKGEASPYLIAPYLYSTGANQIHLAWQYRAGVEVKNPADVVVTTPAGPVTVQGKADGELYVADLPIPGCGFKDVSYQVSGMAKASNIETIACPGDGTPVSFAFIADAQQHPQFVRQISEQMVSHPGSVLLSDGDLVQTGSSLQDWVDYFAATSPVTGQRVTIPAIGNHEYRKKHTEHLWSHFFQKAATDAFYSYNVGEAHVIVLNSCFEDEPSMIDKQLPWLEKELAVPARWKIVMFHHPPYSRGFFNSPLAPKHEFRVLQAKYVPLFEANKVDLVLVGHTHVFERVAKSGVQYVVAGPAGGRMGFFGNDNPFSLMAAKVRTVTYFNVTATDLEAVTLNPEGAKVDSFKLSKAQ